MAESRGPWADPAFLRDVQYRTDVNLASRQSIYAYQHPRIDLQARVLDLAAPAAGATVGDVGCGNGTYLAELARRGFAGRLLGLDMSLGMLAAARQRLNSVDAVSAGSAEMPTGEPQDPADQVKSADSTSAQATWRTTAQLLAADATALPLPDGAADLTLAMHMLYHVPDPSQAVRELRRVTRPGGRVVIGLNGPGHLRQLRALVAAERGGRHERLTLDDGQALLAPYFSSVTRHDFVAELRLADPGPVIDYIRSMSGTQHGDPEGRVAAAVAELFTAPGAVFTVATHSGCLICTA